MGKQSNDSIILKRDYKYYTEFIEFYETTKDLKLYLNHIIRLLIERYKNKNRGNLIKNKEKLKEWLIDESIQNVENLTITGLNYLLDSFGFLSNYNPNINILKNRLIDLPFGKTIGDFPESIEEFFQFHIYYFVKKELELLNSLLEEAEKYPNSPFYNKQDLEKKKKNLLDFIGYSEEDFYKDYQYIIKTHSHLFRQWLNNPFAAFRGEEIFYINFDLTQSEEELISQIKFIKKKFTQKIYNKSKHQEIMKLLKYNNSFAPIEEKLIDLIYIYDCIAINQSKNITKNSIASYYLSKYPVKIQLDALNKYIESQYKKISKIEEVLKREN